MLQARSLKIKKSNMFKKNKFKFKMFLIQTELYIKFNVNKFNKNKKKSCEHLLILKIKHSVESTFMFEILLIIKMISKVEKSISILCSHFETILKQN